MLLDPRNGPAFDLPACEAPVGRERTYVVASTPRTGSTLLCRSLWDTGRVGAPKEYLNPMQVRDWAVRDGSLLHRLVRGPLLALVARHWPEDRLRAHLERVRALRTGPTGWFGLKIHHHHLERAFGDRDPEQILGPVRWIRVGREDRLGQALSWARALQTGRWAHHQSGWLPPLYSRRRIARCLERIDAAEAAWDRRLVGREVLHLTYEQLAGDLQGAVRRVLRYLEVDDDVTVAPPLRQQADATTAAWRARFEAEGPAGSIAGATPASADPEAPCAS